MTIGSPKEDDFAAGLERSGNVAFEFAERYLNKMQAMMNRELGSTPVDSGTELMDYARVRHDPALLRQTYLEPLMQRFGRGRGREEFVKHIQRLEKQLYPPDGKGASIQ